MHFNVGGGAMKRRILVVVIVCIFWASGIFGVVKKQTYTNITSKNNYLNDLQVAILPEQFVISGCEEIEDVLQDIPIIMKGKVTGDIEHLFGVSRQKVEIVKVFKGSNIQEKTEIYVYSNHWGLCLSVEPKSIERGFVNVMEVGKEYLLFLNEQTVDVYSETPIYEIYDDTLIAPVFSYEEKETKMVEIGEEHTYVSYADVKDNEFFCDTVLGYETWKQLKEKLFAEYN